MVALVALPAVACGGDSVAETPTPATVGNVGELPPAFEVPNLTPPTDGTVPPTTPPDTAPPATPPDDSPPATTETPAEQQREDTETNERLGPFAARAGGNRLLAVGDSITNAIGPDHGGQLCADLGRRGWEVGVDAEQGRDIEAGAAVLQRRFGDDDDWDAVIINLGSNYRGDAVDFEARLSEMLAAVRPRPVIVVTVSEHEDDIAEVNYVIRDTTRDRNGVWVLEWSERTRADDDLTGDDGLHLSDDGREVLSAMLAARVGRAPAASGATTGCVALDELPPTDDTTGPTDGTAESSGETGGDDAGGEDPAADEEEGG